MKQASLRQRLTYHNYIPPRRA